MSPIETLRIGEIPRTIQGPDAPKAGGGGMGETFRTILTDSLSQVNDLQHKADSAIKDMTAGGATSLHDTMIALEKAETSFKLMMQVRNKIVDAYHEVLRMQI